MAIPIHIVKSRSRRGFSLIDVLAALFVAVVAIIPLMALNIQANQADLQSRLQTTADNVARQELDTLSSLAFPTSSTAETSFAMPSSVATLYPNSAMAGSYTVSVTGTAPYQVEQIAVQVTWTRPDASGKSSWVRLDTVISQ